MPLDIHTQLEEVADKVQVIDVRSPEEFNGALGHIRGAKLIPLADLARHLDELDRDRPSWRFAARAYALRKRRSSCGARGSASRRTW